MKRISMHQGLRLILALIPIFMFARGAREMSCESEVNQPTSPACSVQTQVLKLVDVYQAGNCPAAEGMWVLPNDYQKMLSLKGKTITLKYRWQEGRRVLIEVSD